MIKCKDWVSARGGSVLDVIVGWRWSGGCLRWLCGIGPLILMFGLNYNYYWGYLLE